MEKLIKFIKKEYTKRSKNLKSCSFCGKNGKFIIHESSYQHGINYELWLICENEKTCPVKFGTYLTSSYVFLNDYKGKIDAKEYINDIEKLIKKWNKLSESREILNFKSEIQRKIETFQKETILALFKLAQTVKQD